jgi:uncharacterized protein DUF2585
MAKWHDRLPATACAWLAAGFILVQALVLLAMGRPPICTCGTIRLWVGVLTSAENSQQLTDWYTFSHILHGVALYGILSLLAPRLPVCWRLAVAVGIEATWEIVENTPFIIDRYRQSALAQGYVGDSILNSVSDTVSAIVGFAIARFAPVWATVTLAIVLELFVGFMIRDNLTLNIIQLIHPVEAISRWQAGG